MNTRPHRVAAVHLSIPGSKVPIFFYESQGILLAVMYTSTVCMYVTDIEYLQSVLRTLSAIAAVAATMTLSLHHRTVGRCICCEAYLVSSYVCSRGCKCHLHYVEKAMQNCISDSYFS